MTWDKRLNYDEYEKIIGNEIKTLKRDKEYYELKKKPIPHDIQLHLAYNCILLTQLMNGSRISEAVEAILNFKEDSNREQKIRARKRKREKRDKKTGEMKVIGHDVLVLVVIPTEVKRQHLNGLNGKSAKQVQNGTALFALNHYKINSHSLRYAWISKMGKLGKPAHLISKAIRHTNVSMIEHYTQEDEADDMKREFVK